MKRIAKIFSLALLLSSLVMFTACNREDSDKVDQDTIWAYYEVFFNNNDGQSYARATFRFSNAVGTKLELSDGAEVRFDGTLIPWKDGLAYYELNLAGNVENGSFEYTDLDGNVYTNSVSIPWINYPADLDTIPKSAAFEMFWEGEVLGDNDSVVIWINGDNEGDAQLFAESDQGASSIILGANQLDDLPVGYADVVMDRTLSPTLEQATGAGGLITGKYRPENIEVFISE
jgi:hypothetical protein